MNIETGELRMWDDLSAEQQTSGKWIKLPPESDAGRPLARRKTIADEIPVKSLDSVFRYEKELRRKHREASTFPNRGRSS